MNHHGYHVHQPSPAPQDGDFIAKLVLIGSILSLIGGIVMTMSAVLAYYDVIHQPPSTN